MLCTETPSFETIRSSFGCRHHRRTFKCISVFSVQFYLNNLQLCFYAGGWLFVYKVEFYDNIRISIVNNILFVGIFCVIVVVVIQSPV